MEEAERLRAAARLSLEAGARASGARARRLVLAQALEAGLSKPARRHPLLRRLREVLHGDPVEVQGFRMGAVGVGEKERTDDVSR